MTRVRAHRRADGTYVKAHNRRTRPRSGTATAAPRRTAAARPSTVRSIPSQVGPTTRVRRYQRADGTRVRSHDRVLPRGAVAVGSGIGGLVLFLLVLAALTAGGGGQSTPGDGAATSSPPTVSPAASR
ncbi:hypothetical protein [Streptomyces sp. NPDC059513]|uniref:hypothetical protein n=1 Tax=unclassified Streptomyces TaxID=2593676 RepID=UPI00367CF453